MKKDRAIPSPSRGGLGRGEGRKNCGPKSCPPFPQERPQNRFVHLPCAPFSRAFFAKSLGCLAFLLLSLPAFAAEEVDNTSHLPLPRFASLRSGEVNMRTGPGFRYPIEWVYTRKGLPVEITAEYDIWRRVRDPEGVQGWISKTELTGKRTALIKEGPHDLYHDRATQSAVVAHLETGTVGQILSCKIDWCKVKFDDIKGYLPKSDFWGAYPEENFD